MKISFVIQGPVVQYTEYSCNNVRRFFPGSEIIVSTGETDKVDRLDYDQLVRNPDPGTIDGWNGNRHIVTSRGGLAVASNSLVCKLRSDIVFYGDRLLPLVDYYWSKFNKTKQDFFIFKQRILLCDYYTVNPLGGLRLCMHPGDWVAFGLKEDVQKLWNVPLATEKTLFRSEQYFWLNCLRQAGIQIPMSKDTEYSKELIDLSFLTIISNFAVAELRQWEIVNMKYAFELLPPGSLITNKLWESLYQKIFP